jgi:hypothetical protein
VPIIAVQMTALQVGDQFVLSFTKILDVAELFAEDENAPGEQGDRAYWVKRSNAASLGVVDQMISLVPASTGSPRVTYNKYHIAVATVGRNFAWFHPRKSASHGQMHILLNGDERTEWVKKLDEAAIFAGPRGNEMKMRISQKELSENESLVRGLLAKAEEMSCS